MKALVIIVIISITFIIGIIILIKNRFIRSIVINKVICDEYITTPIILEPTYVSEDKDIVFRYNLHFCKLDKEYVQNPKKTYKTTNSVLFEEYHVAIGTEDLPPVLIAVEPIIIKKDSRLRLQAGLELVVLTNGNYYRCKTRTTQDIEPHKEHYGDSARKSQLEAYIGEKKYYIRAYTIVGKVIATYADFYYEQRDTSNKNKN